jgi:TonB-linked SusC/RagA family outer membrane protein
MKKTLHLLCMIGKYYLYGFCFQLVFINLLSASDGKAQNKFDINETMVSASFEESSLERVFSELQSKTGYSFILDKSQMKNAPKVTADFVNTSLENILLSLSQSHDLAFRQVNDRISVKKKSSDQKVPIIVNENVIVTGKVLDQNREPLPGASVLEQGTTNGTVTDIDGNFSLEVQEGATLIVSFIGFESRTIRLGGQTVFEIQLEEDFSALSEVVVVGFGTQNKRDVTGAISSVRHADVKEIAVASPEALLQGKAPGVQIVQNSGTPGGEVFIRVRGTASLLGESRPLFVVDGVPLNFSTGVASGGQRMSPLADINPNDIESMEILKDAAATAIYGSRGSNGVILITTKRGRSGKAKVSFDAYSGVQNVWRQLDMLNGQQYIGVLTDALTNRNPNLLNTPPFDSALIPTGSNTDYQSEIFRPAPIQNYSLSVSGGNERITSFVSVNYFNQQGTIIGQEFERYSMRFNLDYQATDRLKVGTSTTLSNTLQDRVETDFSGLSVLANALVRNPNLPVFNPDGSYSVDPFRTENPVMLANEITFTGNQRRVVTSVYAEYEFAKGLVFRSTFGVDYNDDRQNRFIPSFVVARNGIAQANAFLLDEQTVMNDNTLTYSTSFRERHNLTLLAGFGFQKSTLNSLNTGGLQAGTDIVQTVGAIADPFIPFQIITGWGLMSYFGRLNYNFADKFLVESSFRIDGSSRFGANQRYGVFPGLSLGYRLSEEGFLATSTVVSDFKIRAGIGVTGNQDGIGNFASRALYGVGRNYDGNPGIGQVNIPNEDLGWESTTTTNIGLDFALWNGRVSVLADAYLKRTDNLIFAFQLPWTTGFSSIGNANIGKMENRGLELALSTQNFTGAFKWSTDFNISFNRVKITDLPENGSAGSDFIFQLPGAFGVEGPYNIYRIGQPVGSFFGYIYDGVFPSDESVPQALFDRGIRGGDARFIDLNDNGVFDRQNDRAIIGNALPLHIGGITNNFSYKNLELSILFNWSFGNDIYNMTRAVLTSMTEEYNQTTEVLDRWREQGQMTNVPRALYGTSSVAGNAATDASSRYIEDGSFLRMRNATLAYNFGQAFLDRVKLSSARIYVAAQNLITITNYSGLDPENQNLGTGVPILGVDYLTQPQPRTFLIGVNIGI